MKPWGWGGGWTDGRTGGRTDRQMDRFPLCSTGLCPLWGLCPAPPQLKSHYSSRARVPLTTYCLWAAINIIWYDVNQSNQNRAARSFIQNVYIKHNLRYSFSPHIYWFIENLPNSQKVWNCSQFLIERTCFWFFLIFFNDWIILIDWSDSNLW